MANLDTKNLLIRVLVAAIGIPALVLIALKGKFLFLGLILLLVFIGLLEFSKIAKAQQVYLPTFLLILWGILLPLGAYYKGEFSLLLFFLSGFLVLSFWQIKRENLSLENMSSLVKSLSFSFLALFYVAGFFSFLILIRELPKFAGFDYRMGGKWIVFLYVSIWTCDTLAYFVGHFWGQRKLSPVISPNKTVEGALGGILGALIAAWICQATFMGFVPFNKLTPIALLVGTVGQLGDLVESLLKRSAQVKDTSAVIPGHGGVLDRFDSLIFVAPWVYYYLKLFVYR